MTPQIKRRINIGTEIDLENLLTSRMLIQANSGGGKSVIAISIIEQTKGRVPFIVFDYDGEYYPLKETLNNVLIIGGQYADIPLSMKAASLLPRIIVSNQLSVILDISDLKDSEKSMYAKLFIDALIHLPKQLWTAYLVFLEEAHKFCGEQDKQVSAGTVKDLMTRGRKMGLCGILLTQRISKLHKDAAAECNNKFIGRTNLDIDMDRAARELGMTKNSEYSRLSLRDLKPGEFYAYGTSIEPHHVHVVHIGLPTTKLVKSGLNISITPKKPTEKMVSLLSKLNGLPAEAEEELKTISELQKEVVRLKAELIRSNRAAPVDNRQLEKVQANYQQSLVELNRLQAMAIANQKTADGLRKVIEAIDNITRKHVRNQISIGANQPTINIKIEKSEANVKKKEPNFNTPVKSANHSVPVVAGSLGKCAKAIIHFVAGHADREFTKTQIAVFTGYSKTSSGFSNAISELNVRGFIIRNGDKIRVNLDMMDEIVNAAGQITPRTYNPETYLHNLGKCEREVYECLLSQPTQAFTKEEISEITPTRYSVTSSGFNNAISKLNTLGLLRREGSQIRLNPELLEL
jgi:hypothetical protein